MRTLLVMKQEKAGPAVSAAVGYPPGQYMLKSFRSIRRDPLEFLATTWRTYGDTVVLPIPRPPVFLISDPADVRTLLVNAHRSLSKTTIQYASLATVTGNGLLTADDPPWREHRRIVQPAFHHETLPQVGQAAAQAVQPLVQRLRRLDEGAVADLDAEMMAVALQVVAVTLFGSDWQRRADVLTKATISALDQVVRRARNPLPLPLRVPTPGNVRLLHSRRLLDRAVGAVIDQRMNARTRGDDLVQLLVDSGLDRTAIRDELVTFLIAGHETVASALTWALYLVSQHPLDYQPGNLDLATSIIDETLRLYPSAWVISRKATAAIQLSETELPEGALVIISPWIIHRHRTLWSNPDSFEPQRFLTIDAKSAQGYLPFGLGPRMCIGRDFARTEAAVILDQLLSHFRLEPAVPQIARLASVTLRPAEGLPMRIYQSSQPAG